MAKKASTDPIVELNHEQGSLEGVLHLPKSKSMVNRALLLAALFPQITLSGMSTSKDSDYLDWALKAFNETDLFIGAGGTTLRFAMAYWAVQPDAQVVLRGTDALNKRPISAFVDALNALGAHITYLETQNRAPVQITGRPMRGGSYHMGHVESSQFITALMLIAPTFQEGLHLTWDSAPSQPYLMMTAALLRNAGFEVELTRKSVRVPAGQRPVKTELHMEPDWSAVAFWCQAVALSEGAKLQLPGFTEDSLQGDSRVVHYFEPLGVKHTFTEEGLTLEKRPYLPPGELIYNLIGEPDLAQALVLTMITLRIPFEVNGLSTLVGKETDRIQSLVDIAHAFGVHLQSTPSSVRCTSYPSAFIRPSKPFDSLEDHRVAMSLAPLSLRGPVSIKNPEVVSKSYPEFWDHWSLVTSR